MLALVCGKCLNMDAVHGGNQEQKKKLAERLQPEVASLSKDNYGCRVVQKAKFLPAF